MTVPLHRLYSFRRCPYAMRARLGILFAELQVELREITLKNKPMQMLAISPKATVPVLQLADGRVIEESREIMEWVLEQQDPQRLLDSEVLQQVTQNQERRIKKTSPLTQSKVSTLAFIYKNNNPRPITTSFVDGTMNGKPCRIDIEF